MSTTVLEALENAQINFQTIGRAGAAYSPIFQIAMSQLKNAIDALEEGKGPHEELEEEEIEG